GVLAQVNETAAMHVFSRDCLIHLGSVVAPDGPADARSALRVVAQLPDGAVDESIPAGEIRVYPLAEGATAEVEVTPSGAFDMGAGRGHSVSRKVEGGVVGLVVDTRGRPLSLDGARSSRVAALRRWHDTLDLYPSTATD
ncbi:MAG: methylaspartate mutase, partial [Myxococcota bacterium]